MPSNSQQVSELVERVLDKFKNDLWIQRRLALDEVIELLKYESEKYDKSRGSHNVSDSHAQAFQDYIRFIEFLKDQCIGQLFTSDRQWGHLLNLMSVSRKVNHRSAKFCDIIKSKIGIESSFQEIRSFNESVKQASIIDDTLADLEKHLESTKLVIGFSDISLDTNRHSLIAEISRVNRQLRNTSGALVCNLRMQLYSKSIDPMFERDREAWRDTFNRLESIFNGLSQLLNQYHEFVKNFSDLLPLLKSLDGSEVKSSDPTKLIQKDTTLQSQLSSCKAEFNKVIDFDQRLTKFFKSQIKQKGAESKSTKQQVQALYLAKLLDSRLRFKDDLLTVGLQEANKSMRACQDTLSHIRRSLRLEFGRFYFLNDLDLLKLIALDVRLIEQCDQPTERSLIRKIFNNSIEGFTLNNPKEGPRLITGVLSSIGENIDLGEPNWVPLKKRINIYSLEVVRILNEVLRKLRRSLRAILQKTIDGFSSQSRFDLRSPTNDIDWSLPIQLFDLAEHVKFTHRVEAELSSRSTKLKSLVDFYETKLHGLRTMSDVGDCDGKNIIVQLKISAAISITVHFIALLINLDELSVRSALEWNWRRLPRFYAKHSALIKDRTDWNLEVKIATASFVYRFDLLFIETTSEPKDSKLHRSVTSLKRLISTTTSEKCFLAASQAIAKLKSGASPFGPAGSGKTETIKALGHLLGCQVIVHNCDEANDSDSLERLIWGLAHTGLWGCFDEFNRLSPSTLSSVSSTLESVQAGLRSGSMTIELDNGEIKSIDPDSAFFITLNPGDKSKYRGRRRLPANLRSLFLPVAMFHVQIDAIVRQMLLVYNSSSNRPAGLQTISDHLNAFNSSDIAQRLSRWIQLVSDELVEAGSNKCEFDLRLVLAILKRLFRLLAENPEVTSNPIAQLHDAIVASIQAEVVPRLEQRQLNSLDKTLSECFDAQPERSKLDRKSQLKTQLEGRSGVILLGDTQTGKSTSWRTLLAELNKDRETICWSSLNPKAYEKDRLFGHFEATSGKWVDGIFTKLVRLSISKLHNELDLQQAWLILDGDIDPDWIECLNSVLDDNQVLTLSSGERLNFIVSGEKCIKLIFETESIKHASPATISRLGLVYHEKVVNVERPINMDILSTIIVYGDAAGGASQSRFDATKTIASGLEQRSIEYVCSEYCNSDSLIALMQLSSDTPCTYIIQNLDSISSADKWGSKTFVELLRYIVSFKRYYDKDLNEVELNEEIRFIIGVESLNAIKNHRLVAIARTKEVEKGEQDIGESVHDSVNSLIREKLMQNSAGSGILIIRSENGTKAKEAVLASIETSSHSTGVDVYRFNNQAAQTRTVEKLDKISNSTNTLATDGRKCWFLIDSLEMLLMNRANKRRLYDLVNLLRIKQLIGDAIKIIVCLDSSTAEVDTKFWLAVGEACRIVPGKSCAERFQVLLEDKVKAGKDLPQLELLLEEVEKIASDKQWIVQEQFMGTLVEMIVAMREGLRQRTKMLKSGLDKLRVFESHVEEIKRKMQQEDLVLRQRKVEIEKLMEQIDSELERSAYKEAQVQRLQGQLEQKSMTLETQSKKIQSELEIVLPLIENSKQEVSKCLKPEALNEIKTLRSPPKTIKDILDVLLVFLDVQDTSWASIKAYLTRVSLRDELTNFDFAKRLDSERLEKIKREIDLRKDSFQAQQAKRASTAILPILNWINAALEYSSVSVKLKPLTDARDHLKDEAQGVRESMGQLEKERKQLEEKVSEDRNLLSKYQAEYSEAMSAAKKMADELSGARKVIENSTKQVSSWRQRLSKLENLATNHEDLYEVCLISAITTTCANNIEEIVRLLKSFNSRLRVENQLETLVTIVQNNVDVLLESIGEEPVEINTMKSDNLDSILQLVKLKLCLFFRLRSPQRLPFIQLGTGSKLKLDDCLLSALSRRNIVCSKDELLIVRTASGPVGSWRQSFDLGLKMNKLLVVQLDGSAELDVIDAVLEHCHSTRIVLVGSVELAHYEVYGNSLEQLFQMFLIEQQKSTDDETTDSLSDRIGNLLLQQCDPKIGTEMSQLEWSLTLKQREARSLEASLLKKLTQSSGEKSFQSLAATGGGGLRSDLVKTLNQLQKASDSLGASIVEIKDKLADFRSSQTKYAELSKRLAKFYASFLSRIQASDNFYAFPIEKLVEVLLLSSRLESVKKLAAPRIAFEEAQLSQILIHAMCSLRPDCRRRFRDHLVGSCSELAALLDGSDASKVANLIESSYKASADLCHNLINLLSVDKDVHVRNTTATTTANTTATSNTNFDLIVILHDEKKPSPQVLVDELFGRGKSAFISTRDNHDWHYHKVYARSHLQQAGGGGGGGDGVGIASSITQTNRQQQAPLEAHLRRLMMSSSTQASATTTSDDNNQRTLALIQTRCICIANAHLAAGWINTQFLELIREMMTSCRYNERYVFLLIGESSEQQQRQQNGSSPDELSDKLDLNLLEAASLKFWYDELALNALDRYNLYIGPLRDAYAPTNWDYRRRMNDKGKASDADSTSTVIAARHKETLVGGGDANAKQENSFGKNATSELIEDLVMFHVVCQELIRLRRLYETGAAKPCQGNEPALWQKADYNFDYEQLSAALRMWKQMNEEEGEEEDGAVGGGDGLSESVDEKATANGKRKLFCHLLESIVYGSRLETLEDEELLKFLLNCFMQIPPLSNTVREKRLIVLESLARNDLSASADGISSARYSNELAGLIRVLE